MSGWWIKETDFAGDEHLDDSYVAAYDAKAQVDPTEDVDRLVKLGLGPGTVLVDMGAGTGVFSLAAAATGASVIAVDVSPAMASVVVRRADQAGYPNVKVIEGGFLSYEHVGPPANFIYSRNALHQIPDFWKVVALNRMWLMLDPDGHLLLRDLVFDFEPTSIEEGIEIWMEGAVEDPAKGFTAGDLAEHVREEFSTFSWLLEPMLERCGFEVLERASRRSAFGVYLCRRVSG